MGGPALCQPCSSHVQRSQCVNGQWSAVQPPDAARWMLDADSRACIRSTLSSRQQPRGQVARAASAAADQCIKPLMRKHLEEVNGCLEGHIYSYDSARRPLNAKRNFAG